MRDAELEEKAIIFLTTIYTGTPLNVAFSGGKDSIVILDLVRKTGLPYYAFYSNTTIDPPGTIGFIKKNYPDVKIIRPEKSFYKLIQEKGLPTKLTRFCCEKLKERASIGLRMIDGTRQKEGNNRKHYTPEDCDTRKWMKGAKHIRPIVYWTDKEVWNHIKANNLPYIKYYDPPYKFKRHGCVGCPLTNTKQRMLEYRTFPRYFEAVIIAIRKHRVNKPHTKLARSFENEYEAFYWWVSYITIDRYLELKESSLFPILNYEVLVRNAIYS